MSATYLKELSGLCVINISGIMTGQDQKEVENFGRTTIDRSEKIKVLIMAEAFSGWAKKGDWDNLNFMLEYDPYIEKIAVVADEKWRDDMLMFLGAGLRNAIVKFFPMDQESNARTWLG